MLIVPFSKKMVSEKLPIVTILLVAINVIVFSFWQVGDEKRYQVAIDQYLQSSLPNIEFPQYELLLRHLHREREADDLMEMRDDKQAYPMIVMQLQHDTAFLRAISHGEIVKRDDPKYEQWQKDRRDFDLKFNEIIDESHTFKPAFPEISDAFTHMFMHGSIMHLLGNMVFLIIVGLVIERLIGSLFYITSYLIGGFIAVLTYMLGNADSATPLLGASGAIAAMMGAYAALFGSKKIPFFYSLGFYFGYIRAPAFVLLIAWLGNELLQLMNNEGSNVAYLAHFGGLVGGGFLGYLFLYAGLVTSSDLEWEDDVTEAVPWQEEYNRGMLLLGRMETAKAATVFSQLHQEYSTESSILEQYYKSTKYQPESELYHASSQAVLGEAGFAILTVEQVRQIFAEYLQLAKPKARFNRENLYNLGVYFLKKQCLDEAFKLTKLLLQHDGLAERTAVLAVGVAKRLRFEERQKEGEKLLKWVLLNHADTASAVQARTLLAVIA